MNDDFQNADLEQLKQEHRQLDERIHALLAAGGNDQVEVARLKKQKLRIKDQIQAMMDANVPDIIA